MIPPPVCLSVLAIEAKDVEGEASPRRHADTADVTDGEPRVPGRREAPRLAPRLLDVHSAATYLGVSIWTVRGWVADGHLIPVELPPLRPREGDRRKARLRRLLFDREALDRFVDGLSGARG